MLRLITALSIGQAYLAVAQEIRAASATTAAAYASNSDLSLALSNITGPVKGATSGSGAVWNLSIDDTKNGYKQSITGFGAAVTDATVVTFNNLTAANQTTLLSQLFTTTASNTSAGFSMIRHTIGGSDMTPDPAYTYDDSSSADQPLNNFDIGDRGRAMASLLARMNKTNPNLFILGSPWSAPGWMKESGKLDEPQSGCTDSTSYKTDSKNRLSDRYTSSTEANYTTSFANYFVKYLQAFQNQSVNVNAMMIQNEPLNNNPCYPTMFVEGAEAGNLIQNAIGPALAQAKLNTAIWANDDNTRDIANAQSYIDIAGQYVQNVGWHCYNSPNYTVLTEFRNTNLKKYPTRKINQYLTECSTPGATWYGAANFTIGPLQNWASGVMVWTLSAQPMTASDGSLTFGPHLSSGGCTNCRGVVDINSNGTIGYNNAYYNIAQFSRFIPRGAIILNGTGSSPDVYPTPGVQSVASLNPDGTRSVVIMNTMAGELFVNLTTSTEVWGGTVPRKSVTTWVLPKAG